MNKRSFIAAFAAGLAAVAWVGLGFAGNNGLALAITLVIGGAYLAGAWELRQYRAATAALAGALDDIPQPLERLSDWLDRVPASLRHAVRLRVEGERVALPAPALTPYLVGLLVMLGMLGTFLGMVVTFKGTVFALEGSGDLQAMRSALAEPIRGLGLSFGTSVAGVAASAMLGLMSAICRRERMEAGRALDGRTAGALRAFSATSQREEALRALQAQAGALPEVARRLEALMDRIEQRSQQLDEQLLDRQARFQEGASRAYGELAQSVGASLRDSLAAGARAAGESITPVVEAAMARIAQDTQGLHARLGDAAKAQADALAQRLEGSAREVATGWQSALQAHARTSQALAADLQQALAGFSAGFEQRGTALVAAVNDSMARSQALHADSEQQRLQAWTGALQALAADLQAQWQRAGELARAQQQAIGQSLQQLADQMAARASAQAGADEQRLQAWTGALQALAADVHAQWRQAGEQALAQQQAIGQSLQQVADQAAARASAQAGADEQRLQAWTGALQALAADLQARWQQAGELALAQQQAIGQSLQQAADDITARVGAQAGRTLEDAAQLVARSEELVRSRVESEARWTEDQGRRMDELAGLWRSELSALRGEEAARGQAAVERLGQLESAVGQHLATLGAALEAPLSRLLASAAEVPQAAAGVITQLREEMARMSERDNAALDERTALLSQLAQLLQSVQAATGEQRAAIETLVASAASVLGEAGERFAQALQAQAEHTAGVSTQVGASAVELASLAEAFGQGVQAFQATNDRLVDSLERLEASITQSSARSDEQLAYYVAQAREVIDLSIASQQGLVENLRQLQPALAEGARA
ncbi:DUF802 domain-containing protein [Ramlibacter sp. MAHUQ-53]|uniref:DUF802 domain-containing protein n=1 Tax=unclassified Ramlibacter TaxID=2617605 RepID=UPI00363EEA68